MTATVSCLNLKGVKTLNLKEIVKQLKECNYTCEAGPLENNTAFIELEKISNQVVNVTDKDGGLIASVSSENIICNNDCKVIISKE